MMFFACEREALQTSAQCAILDGSSSCCLDGSMGLSRTKGGETSGEAERVLIEDVHGAIADLVELIKTFRSKNRMAQAMTSTLFKRRQEEAEALIDRAVSHLHVSAASSLFKTAGWVSWCGVLYRILCPAFATF